MNLYTDNDPKVCAWLTNLVSAEHLPAGDVWCRAIQEIEPDELSPYTQCHFFSGIGGWPLALAWAGWPADRPVWTGSCPCQPFSLAGQQRGEADERHVWPDFLRLITECRPATVFGEQVGGELGYQWLSGVRADMEGAGYAVGAADLPAACVGAPHIRQRLFWVGNAQGERRTGRIRVRGEPSGSWEQREPESAIGSPVGGGAGEVDGLRDAVGPGSQGLERDQSGRDSPEARKYVAETGPLRLWDSAIAHRCLDGKDRRIPTEPAFFPLAHGVPGRVGRLRGYGNAIVPQVAAEFVKAYMEVT